MGYSAHLQTREGSVQGMFWKPKNISSVSLQSKKIIYSDTLTSGNDKNIATTQILAMVTSTEAKIVDLTMFNAIKLSLS